MKSVMTGSIRQSSVPDINIPRSSFNMSHAVKQTFDSQYLVPCYEQEVIPGDTHNVNYKALIRMSTPIYPIMDNLFADFFFFFVPHRLVWSNFKKMMGEQTNPGDSVDYSTPQMTTTAASHAEGTLYDYFGINFGVTDLKYHNLLGRGYNLIYNEWFRDQNLQNSVTVDTDDGPDTIGDYVLLKRGKRHDYFTSCLPWTQKTGATEALMPLGTTAPVTGIGIIDAATTSAGTSSMWYSDASAAQANTVIWPNADIYVEGETVSTAVGTSNLPQIYADLSNATAASINQLRQSIAIQSLYEKDARGGTRYPEIIFSHFGISNAGGDARLQRPEYLGGGSVPISINPVANTSNTNTGDLAATAYAYTDEIGFTKSFTEHGYIIGLVNCHGDITYQQGTARHFLRDDKLDFYWPSLAQIGEMAVTNAEIYAQGTAADDNVFGYQEQHADLRYKPSRIAGAFRSGAATPLDAWHLSEEFTTLPTLGATFIQDNTPVSRVVATPSEPEFIMDAYVEQYSARPLPMYGIPATLGRF